MSPPLVELSGCRREYPSGDGIFTALCDLDLPMFIHGYNQSVTWGRKANDDRYETTAIVGMQYDETRCFWNLVCGGVLYMLDRRETQPPAAA